MKFKIYGLECLVNHKIYVGKTSKTLEERIHWHKYANSLIGRAIRKYGWEKSFIAVILAECETNKEANELEKFWIAKLNCKAPNGYNLTDGGDGVTGHVISLETRAKISAKLKGHIVSAETRRKLSIANKGKKISDEVKEKISKAGKGRKFSEETLLKMSKAQKIFYSNPENRKKHGEIMREQYRIHPGMRKKHSIESRKKMSEKMKGNKYSPKFHNEETRLKMSNSRTGKKHSDETRAKISAGLKNYYKNRKK